MEEKTNLPPLPPLPYFTLFKGSLKMYLKFNQVAPILQNLLPKHDQTVYYSTTQCEIETESRCAPDCNIKGGDHAKYGENFRNTSKRERCWYKEQCSKKVTWISAVGIFDLFPHTPNFTILVSVVVQQIIMQKHQKDNLK